MINYRTPRRRDAEVVATDRRGFLKLAAASGAAGLVAACGWDGGNSVRPSLLSLSRMNDWVGENVLFSPTRLAKTYSPAERSRMLPSYFISDVMPELQNPAGWRFKVDGLVRTPLSLSLDDLTAMPRVTYTVKHHCVEGFARCQPLPAAGYIMLRSFDSDYSNGWDLASALHPQTILAYGMNDNPLPPAHGAPLRLYSPTKLGYKMTKYLLSMTFMDTRPGGYWEDQGYPWFAGV
ncbi:MAG: molybdopterin-binding protein [Gemmatimonadetes bacterium]|nr:MAG: molybdopterin-binding protein [Gemmatimonadota bacterium]